RDRLAGLDVREFKLGLPGEHRTSVAEGKQELLVGYHMDEHRKVRAELTGEVRARKRLLSRPMGGGDWCESCYGSERDENGDDEQLSNHANSLVFAPGHLAAGGCTSPPPKTSLRLLPMLGLKRD